MKRRHALAGLACAPNAVTVAAQPARPLLAILSSSSPRNEVVIRNVNLPFKEAPAKLGYARNEPRP
jgi:hypothetical protein